MLDKKLISLLVCPVCKASLQWQPTQAELICRPCRVAYPVRDDIPVMLVSEARHVSLEELEGPHG